MPALFDAPPVLPLLTILTQFRTVEQLPPTLLLQNRFLEVKSVFRPYVGPGVTYAIFQKETGSGTLTALINPAAQPRCASIMHGATLHSLVQLMHSMKIGSRIWPSRRRI